MKKKHLIAILLAALLLTALAVPALAADLLSIGVTSLGADSGMIKSGLKGDEIRFSATDFKQAMGIRKFDGITVTALPQAEHGALRYGNTAVTVGMTIPRDSLNLLCFTPADDSLTETTFSFTCDRYAGGAEMVCTIRYAERVNQAPTVSDVVASKQVSTLRDIAVDGTLCATDPEGDALEFLVIAYPKHGSLMMLDSGCGDFRYTPKSGYTGTDSFTYVVRDCYGNYTEPTTARIRVEQAGTSLTYADMGEKPASLAAIVLAKENIMLGTLAGDHMHFYPEEGVERGEFVVMAMKAAGITPEKNLTVTVFDDDESIPEPIRGYIATAQKRGYIVGELSEAGLCFHAGETITRAEAAMVLARILEARVPVSVPLFPDAEAVPAYAKEAIDALCAMGVYARDEQGNLAAKADLDRAAAAEMLYGVLQAKN